MAKLQTLKPTVQLLGSAPSTTSSGWSKPHRGNRHQRGYGTQWDKLRLRILQRDCYLCQTCLRADRITSAKIVDHRVPKAEGGTDDPSNLEAICSPHHTEKTASESNRSRGGG